MFTAKVSGKQVVVGNLNKEVKAIEGRTLQGILAAALKVQRLAQQRVPIEYGILRASAYTQVTEDKEGVEVGFTADYAVYVHENLGQTLKGRRRPSGIGVYWGPAGQPKFLESAINDLHDDIVKTIAAHAEVKE